MVFFADAERNKQISKYLALKLTYLPFLYCSVGTNELEKGARLRHHHR